MSVRFNWSYPMASGMNGASGRVAQPSSLGFAAGRWNSWRWRQSAFRWLVSPGRWRSMLWQSPSLALRPRSAA